MLILDKQKAVEHIVALTSADPVAVARPEERPGRIRARSYHRVARYERKTAAADGGLPPRRSPFRFRRRLVPNIEGTPV
ncbi:MAG: hypothetical protein WEB52_03615 [Dehalococcoidia bacterium]